jgi:hypothetical protein
VVAVHERVGFFFDHKTNRLLQARRAESIGKTLNASELAIVKAKGQGMDFHWAFSDVLGRHNRQK